MNGDESSSSGFDNFLSTLEYSAAAGLAAGVNSAFGNPTLTQQTSAVVAPASAPMSTNTLLIVAAAVVVLIVLVK
jgi:hypothetical protein